MDMNSYRPETHVAQQSRRDKLRFPPPNYHYFGVYNNNNNNIINNSDHQLAAYDDPSEFCPEMNNNLNHPASDPQSYYGTWKSIADNNNNNCWVSANNNNNTNFVGQGLQSCSSSSPVLDVKPYTYQDLQELVTTSSFVQNSAEETRHHGPNWVVNDVELLLLPDQFGLKGSDESPNTRALALSLSSVPDLQRDNNNVMVQDFRVPNKALANRNPGPLGPFTGYATILRSSKFVRPAQILLEELCGTVERPYKNNIGICEEEADKVFLEEIRVSGDQGVGNGMDSYGPPQSLQKKTKLLYMQDEVYKKYKQYHEQMQMVVSSFESVAGLSASTPYVSLALKMVSKHFRCLKNAIMDQLKSIRNVLGEELLSSSAGTTSGTKGEAAVSMLKLFDQSFQKQKGVGNLDMQNIWRPQRGLPERAVSILRAWLFDHFLHPYPTDTDKHMLASQTGLTRNQVSNWFINARVRVWKPMVEEIHMLETKGMVVDTGSDGKTTEIADCDQANYTGQCSNTYTPRTSKMPDNYSTHPDPSSKYTTPSTLWNQEKRSRIEYHGPTRVFDEASMGFVGSHCGGVEMTGMGAVSLTLGLRQSAENGQRQPDRHHLRHHYGNHIIRDFVG
ncbi:hypothetical protein CASFOL_037672 [Castilleja foliolosa]|uniref:Homeobox domain-containing protein n=1 Tax=Castilleja foliolosa TaxID=1961234 RepID=A0ABD3BMD8_9LAMI